jgi:hypothetical protein
VKKRTVIGALVLAIGLPACVVRVGPPAPELSVFGPAVVVASGARHLHAPGCGHAARWYGGRWVYFVEDRWEYVEGARRHVYRTVRSEPAVRPRASRRPPPDSPTPVEPSGGRPREYDPDDAPSRQPVPVRAR